jgi:hypothetical protein
VLEAAVDAEAVAVEQVQLALADRVAQPDRGGAGALDVGLVVERRGDRRLLGRRLARLQRGGGRAEARPQQVGDLRPGHERRRHVKAAQGGAQPVGVLERLASDPEVLGERPLKRSATAAPRAHAMPLPHSQRRRIPRDDKDVADVDRRLVLSMHTQRVLGARGETAQRLPLRALERLVGAQQRLGRRVGLCAAAREEVVEAHRRRLRVALDAEPRGQAREQLREAARHARAAVGVEDERVARHDLEVAHERAIGADEQAVVGQRLDRQQLAGAAVLASACARTTLLVAGQSHSSSTVAIEGPAAAVADCSASRR